MSFDVMAFLEENRADFQHDINRDDYLPMQLDAGWGVYSGRNTKLFPVLENTKEASDGAKAEAKAYLEKLDYGFMAASVRQTWYADFLNRKEQPNWPDGKWEEMDYYQVEQVNGEEVMEPFWAMFMNQWAGDEAPVSRGDFGKKLWVRSTSRSHPDFDPDKPNYRTTQMKNGAPVVGDDGVNRKRYLRLALEVIGRTKEEAVAWLKAHDVDTDGGSDNGAQKDDLEKALLALRDELPPKMRKEYKTDEQWVGSSLDIFNGLHNHEDQSAWIESGLVTQEVVDKIAELTNVYPPF